MSVADAILGEGGPVAAALGDRYEPRAEQIEMARAVDRAMEARANVLVEAGTGVGKSFAYLVPAIARAASRREVVVVATNTISLQEQLMENDIPLLASTLGDAGERPDDGPDETPGEEPGGNQWGSWGGGFKAVLVKGRGNYLSVRRLKLASARAETIIPDAAGRRSLQVIEEWAYETGDGSLSTLPALERPGVWDRVQSDSGNCMGRKCPTHDVCFYQNARREMEGATLLVCNHALFFSDLALRARGVGMLPKYDHVILDEAHAVEDVAADHFGLSLSEGRVAHLLGSLYHRKTSRGYLAQLKIAAQDAQMVDRAVELVLQAESAMHGFFDGLRHARERAAGGTGRVREGGLWENTLTPIMNDLSLRLGKLKDASTSEADRFELNAYMLRAREVADSAEALTEQTVPGCVYWIDSARSQYGPRRPRVTLACAPVDVAPALREHLFDKEQSVVLTSATLSTRTVREDETSEHAETAFAHFISRLGCEGASTLQLGSPYEHARQVELYVDRSMPAPPGPRSSPDAHEHYRAALGARVLDHVIATEGGAFVLFTSLRLLGEMAERLREPMQELGYELLAQNIDGSRAEVLSRFRARDGAVLFGAASFWQGVDVRGRALRNVIITRLPFEPPDRPLTEARLDLIRERGGDPFRDDSLPRAVIRFKQGFGRLIRSGRDRGRVVVLDPRVVTTGYGRRFLDALPDGVEPRMLDE